MHWSMHIVGLGDLDRRPELRAGVSTLGGVSPVGLASVGRVNGTQFFDWRVWMRSNSAFHWTPVKLAFVKMSAACDFVLIYVIVLAGSV